jgi:hypothetical protein
MAGDNYTLRYFHLRLWPDEYDDRSFFSRRGPLAKGGVTVVYSPLSMHDGMLGRFCSFAVCSVKDNYDKAEGRGAAELNAVENVVIFVVADDDLEDVVDSDLARRAIIDAIFKACGVSKRHWNEGQLTNRDLKKMQRFIGERKGNL